MNPSGGTPRAVGHERSNSEFAASVERLRLAIRGVDQLTAVNLAVIRAELRRAIGRRMVGVDAAEVDDVIDESIARFVARSSRLDATRNPAGYLVRIAQNTALDRLRARSRERLGDLDTSVDDPTSAVIRRLHDSLLACEAVRLSLLAGDPVAARVVTAFLDLARRGMSPSTRAVAAVAGVTHPTVAHALGRVAERLGPLKSDVPLPIRPPEA